jgi:hypothetical protein
MITFATQRLLFVTALLLTYGAIAQAGGKAMESDWLELVKGSRGAQFMEIETNDTDSTRTVTLAIPKQSMGDPDEIEEVLVIGKMPEKSEPLDVSYEWVRDYDDDNYGLIIHMGSENNWPIRIFMNAVQEVEQ